MPTAQHPFRFLLSFHHVVLHVGIAVPCSHYLKFDGSYYAFFTQKHCFIVGVKCYNW